MWKLYQSSCESLVDVVIELVVGTESGQSSQSETVREEYLCDRVHPHFAFQKLWEIWLQVESEFLHIIIKKKSFLTAKFDNNRAGNKYM